MLGSIRPEERPDLVPWLDQTAEYGETLGDLHDADLGIPKEKLDAIVAAMEAAGETEWAAWARASHGLARPTPDLRSITFDKWQDASSDDGRRMEIRVQVDAGLSQAIERHFGIPQVLLDSVFTPKDPELAEHWRIAWHRSLMLHGLHHDLMINTAWHVHASVKALESVSRAIIAASGRGEPNATTDRHVVEALASYVQNAVPYRRIRALPDGKYRYGYRTPLQTLLEGGDCDSKSMLLICLIRAVRPTLPLALIHIDSGEPHAMLAVGGIGADGEVRKTFGGVEHVLIESTSDWDIGRISEDSDESTIKAFRIPCIPATA